MQVDVKEMRAAIGAAKRAAGRRSTVAILEGVRLTPSSVRPELEVYATDMDVSAHISVPATGNGLGACVISGSALAAVLKGAKGSLELHHAEPGRVWAGNVQLHTLELEDYPAVPGWPEGSEWVDVDAEAFREAAAVVLPAASRDESRPVLTGVSLEVLGDGSAVMVATDSYRLHVTEIPAGAIVNRSGGAWSAIIGHRALLQWLKLPGSKSADRLTIRTSGSRPATGSEPAGVVASGRVALGSSSEHVSGRAIEGQYPNWRQLLPDTGGAARYSVPAPAAIATLTAAESFLSSAGGRGANHPVRLELGDGLEVSADLQDVGSFGPAPITGSSRDRYGDPSKVGDAPIGVNAGFLRDAIAAAAGSSSEPVSLELVSPMRPMFVTGPAGRGLVMPVRLKS